MKKIKVKGAPKKTKIMSSQNDEPKQLYHAECEECGKDIAFSSTDIEHGAYGCVMVKCPKCGKRTYVPCEEEELLLTKDNLVFPNHFAYFGDGKQLIKTEIEQLCREAIEHSRKPEAENVSYAGTGNTIVFAIRNSEETNVYVCQNYYHTAIPETEAIKFPEINNYS